MNDARHYYVTTAIPYVNAKPHIGFAQELVQADVLARYRREQRDDVFFLTGTDDNALKNVQAAEAVGVATAAFVSENASVFLDLTQALNISNNYFVRTSEPAHFVGAQALWSLCKAEDIYKRKYKGLYCVGCELFYAPGELVDGKCPEHNREPEEVEEDNYFFRLSNYQKKLEQLIDSDTYHIVPASRKKEMLSFIRGGLRDFSISRSVARAKGWGVPVPGDSTQIMYVWFDALANYITALGFASKHDVQYKKYWPADVHVVGKGIIRFHAVYWPAMLMSAGLPLPKQLFVHGYINVDGVKMSKSLGNVVDPFLLIEKYGAEAVRFYLLKHIHPFEDSNFLYAKFEEAYNADLSNGLGNLVSRVTNMVEKYCDGKLKTKKPDPSLLGTGSLIELFDFRGAMQRVWDRISQNNWAIDTSKPWDMAKTGETTMLRQVLVELVVSLKEIAFALRPFLPETASRIEAVLMEDRIVKAKPLFVKIQG